MIKGVSLSPLAFSSFFFIFDYENGLENRFHDIPYLWKCMGKWEVVAWHGKGKEGKGWDGMMMENKKLIYFWSGERKDWLFLEEFVKWLHEGLNIIDSVLNGVLRGSGTQR